MENKAKLVSTLCSLNFTIASSAFVMRVLNDEMRLAVVNLIPLFFSSMLGAGVSLLIYLSVRNIYQRQMSKIPMLSIVLPLIFSFMLLESTGVEEYWLIEPFLFMFSSGLSMFYIVDFFEGQNTDKKEVS